MSYYDSHEERERIVPVRLFSLVMTKMDEFHLCQDLRSKV